MAEVQLTVDAVLRDPSPGEVVEALERNPGSQRLADRGWQPLFFELRVGVGGQTAEHHHSVVWRDPARAIAEVAEEELDLALEEALRNLRDLEGLEVWPGELGPADRAVRVEVTR